MGGKRQPGAAGESVEGQREFGGHGDSVKTPGRGRASPGQS